MRVRRLIGTALTTTLVASPLALVAASPAAAATPTAIVPSSGSSWISLSSYRSQPGAPASGDSVYFYIDVASTDGSTDPYAGTVTVQRQLAGQSTWTTIGTSEYAGYSGSSRLVQNATYRVLYSGGTSGSSSWAPAQASLSVKVQRKLDVTPKSGRQLGLAGKVVPKGKVAVTVLKKQGKKWKRFKTVRTNRKGAFFAKLPAPPRRGQSFYWRLQIKPSTQFAQTRSGVYRTYKY